ncbi:hypothetical protein DM02DRAFT_544792 [Periconia macrospinosa]|uniref:Pheromone alpha factor receptor n=1 Tax=Periconia macrospinosa TaxID=97972 RepID=A0A2V1D366_9PLEO|nr:hypothetical protein DM02DRAFT_544792 [Periconia macrospinosa]
MAESSVDPNLDRWNQDFTLIGPDGKPFVTNMAEFDFMRQWGIRVAINWASQIGASGILLFVLLLLTKREKRKSSIFIINALCLILNTTRSVLQCVWLTTDYYHPYSVVANDYSRVSALDEGNTIASNTILLILVILIMVSLSLQVWVVCITLKPLHKFLIMGGTTLVALVAIGFRFAVAIIDNIQTKKQETMKPYTSLIMNMHITQAVAVWVYSCIFTFKLGQAILQRKRMNMTQFGPMQIIFIMGCQTMIVPAIFTSLQFYESVPELASQSYTIICIFLPLSAIWAGLVTRDGSIGSDGADGHQRLLRDQFYRTPTSSVNNSKLVEKQLKPTYSIGSSSGKGAESPVMMRASPQQGKSEGAHAIYVDRDWSVDEGEASTRKNSV